MHPKMLQCLPKQGPLYPFIGTFDFQEASVQLLAICFRPDSVLLQGKDAVECRQPWPSIGLRTRAQSFAIRISQAYCLMLRRSA